MGLFTGLFGSSGSDKADKLRQQALDAFNSIKTPELSQLQIQLDKYVQAGTLTPQQAETALLSSNAFNDIITDPSFVGAQKQALQQLQQIGTEGGLTAIDRARMQDITDQLEQQNRSQNEATMQQAQQRGVGGSELNTVNRLINEQAAADRAARTGVDVAAQAQARALQALQAAGQQGGALEAQQYGEQANKAQAQNAIDVFNKQALNQTNLFNTQTANAAEAANLANAQAIANANTATTNAQEQYNKALPQQLFQDELAKAQGKAGIYTGWANDAAANAAKDRAADVGFTSGLLQTGATALGAAMGGPAGAVAAQGTTSQNPQFGKVYNPTQREMGYAEGGEVSMEPGEFEDEHKRLLSVLHNPSPEVRHQEAEKQKDEMAEHGFAHGGRCYDQGGEVKYSGIDPAVASAFESGFAGKKNEQPIEWDQAAGKWLLKDTNGETIGAFESYPEASLFSDKIRAKQPIPETKDFRDGGKVPGRAEVPGDSVKNDTVTAKLSPGEVVVPRSAMSDEEEFKQFMDKFAPEKKNHPATKLPPEARAMANLHHRISKLEGK